MNLHGRLAAKTAVFSKLRSVQNSIFQGCQVALTEMLSDHTTERNVDGGFDCETFVLFATMHVDHNGNTCLQLPRHETDLLEIPDGLGQDVADTQLWVAFGRILLLAFDDGQALQSLAPNAPPHQE